MARTSDRNVRNVSQTSITADGVNAWSITTGRVGMCRHAIMHGKWSFEAVSWKNCCLNLSAGATHFGYLHVGSSTIECDSGIFQLRPGMYFSIPGCARLEGAGCGQLTSQPMFTGLFQIGGPIEVSGRLAYIDGCSDTLLIPPTVRGDACMNLLHLPPNTEQTAHKHPSFRCGLVTSGSGICQTATSELPLVSGTAFTIEAHAVHSFHTGSEGMRVIAFHPDSDYGPWHDDHPMVNRTIIEGTPASKLTLEQRHVSAAQRDQAEPNGTEQRGMSS